MPTDHALVSSSSVPMSWRGTPPHPSDCRAAERARQAVDGVFRSDSRRVFATLVRVLGGDFDLAEDALQDAFTAAVEQWPREGVPANPRAWLVSAGRFKAVDTVRRRVRFQNAVKEIGEQLSTAERNDVADEADAIADDRLRLVFTCCHPELPPEARVALTLREVCGLSTDEIARAFLTSTTTVAQRIVRAKAKIRDARIPYEVPSRTDLPQRLGGVLHVVYLVFTEGYASAFGGSAARADLSEEAIRLGRLLVELLHDEAEARGLLALMLLHESRRAARSTADGDLILLEDQDRGLWNRRQIKEGVALVEDALRCRPVGPFALQAAVAAVHAEARDAAETDWAQIVALYDLLALITPSPVVALNRAAAVAMRDGPDVGLALIDALLGQGELGSYAPAHIARAELLRRAGRTREARRAFERALTVTPAGPERRFVEDRRKKLS